MKKNIRVTVSDDDGNVLDTFTALDIAQDADVTLDELDIESVAVNAADVIKRLGKFQDLG